MIPTQEEWEFVLDPDDRRYHTQPPESGDGQFRMPISPIATEFTEVLTWEFPEVDPGGMGLRFRWDEIRVDLVEGRYSMAMG